MIERCENGLCTGIHYILDDNDITKFSMYIKVSGLYIIRPWTGPNYDSCTFDASGVGSERLAGVPSRGEGVGAATSVLRTRLALDFGTGAALFSVM